MCVMAAHNQFMFDAVICNYPASLILWELYFNSDYA